MKRRDFLALGAGLFNPLSEWSAAAAAKPKRVIVAGAGLAGLTAAYELTKRGHDVVVLEASDRTGGHVHTICDELPDGLYADVGAEHFTKPGYEICWNYFDELNLPVLAYPHRENMLRLMDGRLMPERDAAALERSRMAKEGFNSREIACVQKQPSAGLLNLYFDRYIEKIHDEYRPFGVGLDNLDNISVAALLHHEGASAAAVKQVGTQDSALHTIWKMAILRLRHVDEDPHALFRVRGGNQQLPDALAKRLAGKIRKATPIVAIRYSGTGVEARCKTKAGETTVQGDYLICCLNAVALRQVKVSPEWPDAKRYAIQNVPYTVESRPLFLSRTKFWKTDGFSGNMDFGSPFLGEIWPMADEVRTEKGLLIGAAQSGATADKALAVFRRYYPGKPTIERSTVFDWAHDPWSMVCEARTYRPGELRRMWPATIAPVGRVHFAGAYCDNQSWGMEAASRSGVRAARAVHEA